jgi:hypothetical protein
MDSFRIINEIKDGFQFVHSTRLYPEWPFAACGTTDAKLAREVAKGLILLKSTDKAMVDAKVYGRTYRPTTAMKPPACVLSRRCSFFPFSGRASKPGAPIS